MDEERLKEIMQIAATLNWLIGLDWKNPENIAKRATASYPLMQGSEVEKCMIMMVNDEELERYRQAAKDPKVCEMNKEILLGG